MEGTIALALAALLAGLSKGGLGGPIPVSLTTPILALVMPVSEAVGLLLPLLIFADMFALFAYWRQWDMRHIRLLLPAAVIGIVIGTLTLSATPDDLLRRIVGLFTLSAVLYKVACNQLQVLSYKPRNWHGRFAGWASGFGSTIANAGSPPFTAYMLLQPDFTPTRFIGSTTLFFSVVNLLKMPLFLQQGVIDPGRFLSVAWALAIIPIGVWLGYRAVLWIDPKLFEHLLLAILFLMSLYLIFG